MKKTIASFFSLVGILFGSFVFFVVFFLTAKSLLPVLPDMTLFRQIEFDVLAGNYSIPFFDVIFFAIGLLVFCIGVVSLVRVTEYNSSAINTVTRKSHALLTDHFYAEARHPMSGALMVLEIGLFISVRTLYALICIAIIVLIQTLSCFLEEKFVLEKEFGADYIEYKKKVRSVFFSLPLRIIAVTVLGIVLAGLYLMSPQR